MIKLVGLLLAVVAVALCTSCGYATDSLTSDVVSRDGKTLVVISNASVQLTFEPARGGRCVSFRFLDVKPGTENDGEIINQTDVLSGMFLDHWAKYTWPSGLVHLPYSFEILKSEPKRIGIRLWITVPAVGGGRGTSDAVNSLKVPTSPDLIGLVVSKTIWLSADTDAIVCDFEVSNPTNESRGVAPYIQHNFSINGSRFSDIWYLPSTRGVSVNVQPAKEEGRAIGVDWVLDPTAGWIGVRDEKTNRGLMLTFDYNYVVKTYTCGSTAEWFMETVPVAPGKSFKTTYIVKPVKGFKDFAWGSPNLVADLRAAEVKGTVKVISVIEATNLPHSNLALDITVTGWKSKVVIAQKSFKIKEMGLTPVLNEFSFKPVRLTDGVVIAAHVTGQGINEKYEYYYAGDKDKKERRYGFFAQRGGALAGARGDAYFVKQPRKAKVFDKPNLSAIARPAPDKFKCLVVFGLYTDVLKIDDALAGWKSAGGASPEFSWSNCPPNAIEKFPGSYDELFSYNAVVLSDVNFKSIGDVGFEMICDYVQQGGSLILAGGPYAYGNGEFEDTRVLEVLPLTISGPFDLKWAESAKSWPITAVDANSPILSGVSFASNPRVFWQHFVEAKPGSQVVLKAGDNPALIVGAYGKGRVAAFTLAPLGAARADNSAWWNWESWPQLVKNVFTWLDSKK